MKALNSIRALVAILVLALPATVFSAETRIQLVGNIATLPHLITGATATASTSGPAGGPALAVDGNMATRWESALMIDPSWITLDLGTAYDLATVVIHWEAANAETYEIRGSNDNVNWTTLASESGGTFGDRTDTVNISGNYRYVQMYGITRSVGNNWGYSIWEMQVYGNTAGGPDSDNDGVEDSVDQCPGTPANTPVESDGCEINAIGGYDAPTSYTGYSLVWNDEFNGTSLNTADWTHEIGTGCPGLCGWGNNELQYYRAENTTVANGVLTIEAKQENFMGSSYTSSRIKTQTKQSFQYGRIDIRAVLPEGQGLWPAAWMLGESIPTVGWPQSGEIDIMEMIGGLGREDTVHGTLHWQATGGYASYGGSQSLPFSGYTGTYADEYHVFSIVWDASQMIWYVNNVEFHVTDITPSHMDEFRDDFFFLLNVAVGGIWPGPPDGTTTFPQKMIVDYVRVYQQP